MDLLSMFGPEWVIVTDSEGRIEVFPKGEIMSARRNDRKEARREAAEKATAAWQELSPAEQLAALDKRLGKGKGAKKQRARIQKRLK